jgi:hypothetical protein
MAQLVDHPLADHLTLSRMVKDVHLPEGEKDFTIEEFVHDG